MPGPVDLGVVRGKKKEPCEYCGGEEHAAVFACPRIKSITYNNETDEVTLRFWGESKFPDDPPLAG